ncbi:Uncharacterised protein [Lelliottia amnigena]|nr:Uncharacterised protein [Lelliottia amnigena]
MGFTYQRQYKQKPRMSEALRIDMVNADKLMEKTMYVIWLKQKISLRKGVYTPLQQGLSAVQCGFARHTRPLKTTINHSSVDTVWTL